MPTALHSLVLAGIVLSCLPALAAADSSPLRRNGEPPARRSGVARVGKLEVERDALQRLRASEKASIDGFPFGADRSGTIVLERFDPFATGARAVLMTAAGARPLSLPDRTYFRGKLNDLKDSHVLVVAGPDFVRGFVADGKDLHRFGPDAGGQHIAWSLSDADPAIIPTTPLCQNDAYPELAKSPRATVPASVNSTRTARAARGPYNPTLLAEIYVETDQEFLELFAGPAEALDYLGDLAAAISTVYDADTDVRIVFRTIRLWESTDPWRSSSTGGMLNEVREYWTANEFGTPRDLVHFLSGKGVTGGVAYLGTLCDAAYGYGVSTVFGSFDVMNPNDTWDVTVVAHELGHNFGSPHTHCYVPPIDTCYAGEGGCYNGVESLPPGGGTIMSYCHLLPGGDANINLTFGSVVSDVIRTGAVGGACVGDPCGDGILDPGEACDDGNIVGGDCCAADCSSTATDGTSCDDGEGCTTADQCTGGSCGGTVAPDGSPCDDGSQCTSDSCQGGECVSAPAPDLSCLQPTLPGAAQIALKNPAGGRSDAVSLRWNKGPAVALGDFGDPLGSDDYELCLYDNDGDLVLAAKAPAGGTCADKPCWKAAASGFTYSDKLRSPNGVTKLILKSGDAGSSKVSVKGKGEPLAMTPIDDIALPLRSQVRGNGQCFEATFSVPAKRTSEQLKARSN